MLGLNPGMVKCSTAGENGFLGRLVHYLQRIQQYYNEKYISIVMKTIPLIELYKNANDRMKKLAAEEEKGGKGKSSYRDELMKSLLHWYKHKFFKWRQKAQCSNKKCVHAKKHNNTKLLGMGVPNLEERQGQAGRVEIYKCQNPECGRLCRYPRYNLCVKLLESRCGRCGEWANCFSMIATACGFTTRFCVDWTDHVWIEYYSKHHKKWIHCDPCENAWNTPWVYSEGWKKKLTFVIAFHKEQIVDVSKRYIKGKKNWGECLERRKKSVSEKWLAESLKTLNYQLSIWVVPERKKVLAEMGNDEQKELEKSISMENDSKKKDQLKEGEKKGRISGDREWKKSRGEFQFFKSFDYDYVGFKTGNVPMMKKKLHVTLKKKLKFELTGKEKALLINGLNLFEFIFPTKKFESSEQSVKFTSTILQFFSDLQGKELFPVIDLLRLLIVNEQVNKVLFVKNDFGDLFSTSKNDVFKAVLETFESSLNKVYANELLILRFWSNMFIVKTSRAYFQGLTSLSSIFKLLAKKSANSEGMEKYLKKKGYCKALSSFLLNCSKFVAEEKEKLGDQVGMELAKIVLGFLLVKNVPSLLSNEDLEKCIDCIGILSFSMEKFRASISTSPVLDTLKNEIVKRKDESLTKVLTEFQSLLKKK